MAKLFITKGKLLKDSTEIAFIKRDDEDAISTGNESFTAPVAVSLKRAFEKLAPHAAFKNEFVTATDFDDIEKPPKELLDEFIATGFTLTGGEQMKAVIITAKKVLKTGEQFTFNTPLIVFADDSDNSYKFKTELLSAIKVCQKEFVLYVGGKHGTLQQQEMNFKAPVKDETVVDAEFIEIPDKPKRKQLRASKKQLTNKKTKKKTAKE